jgi:DNA-binding MarR family transcriptional regulator
MLTHQEPVALLVAAARRRIKQAVHARLRGLALSAPQFWFLLAIRDRPGSSLKALAEQQRLDLPSSSRLAASLAAKGLIAQGRSSADRRLTSFGLTAAGSRLAAKLGQEAERIRRDTVAGFSQAEEAQLQSLLQRVLANLNGLEAPGPGARPADAKRRPARP